jgi:hypothetical protein
MQIEYAISINIEINADGQKITNGYISCETLPPLAYLSNNSLGAARVLRTRAATLRVCCSRIPARQHPLRGRSRAGTAFGRPSHR